LVDLGIYILLTSLTSISKIIIICLHGMQFVLEGIVIAFTVSGSFYAAECPIY
jgi:hypothetical protein